MKTCARQLGRRSPAWPAPRAPTPSGQRRPGTERDRRNQNTSPSSHSSPETVVYRTRASLVERPYAVHGMRTAIITISTAAARGEREDLSGQALGELASAAGAEVVARELVPDDRGQIEEALRRHAAPDAQVAVILTTGGTGLTPDDITPEATRAV